MTSDPIGRWSLLRGRSWIDLLLAAGAVHVKGIDIAPGVLPRLLPGLRYGKPADWVAVCGR